jgi:hypothetical protein
MRMETNTPIPSPLLERLVAHVPDRALRVLVANYDVVEKRSEPFATFSGTRGLVCPWRAMNPAKGFLVGAEW